MPNLARWHHRHAGRDTPGCIAGSVRRVTCLAPATVGSVNPPAPVIAAGRSQSHACGRSPNPLPKLTIGWIVLNPSAPTLRAPVPPISAISAVDISSSCGSLRKVRYFSPRSRLSHPVDVRPPGVSRRHPPPTSADKSDVSEREYSPVTCRPLPVAVSPVAPPRSHDTVGNDISSSFWVSSTTRVDGNKRSPAIPLARAGSLAKANSTRA